MTAAATRAVPTRRPARIPPTAAVRFAGVMHSEWIKLVSLRSTVWAVLAIGATFVGLTVVTMGSGSAATLPVETAAGPTLVTIAGTLILAQIPAAVLGALSMSVEYSTGMVTSSFAAVPRRLPVLLAKAIVLFGLVFVVTVVSLVISWAISLPYLAEAGFDLGLTEHGLGLAIAGTAAGLGFVAVVALGVGAILRSAAGAITILLGLLFAFPILVFAAMARAPWLRDVYAFVIGRATEAMGKTVVPGSPLFSPDMIPLPWLGGLISLGWVVASLLVAAVLIRSRDA